MPCTSRIATNEVVQGMRDCMSLVALLAFQTRVMFYTKRTGGLQEFSFFIQSWFALQSVA